MAQVLTHVLRTKQTAILAAIQPNADTFVMPVAADFLQVRNVSLDPLAHSTIELNEVCMRLGSRLKTLSAQHVKLSFEAIFRGIANDKTAPNVGLALRMCGFSETATNDPKKAVYAPVDRNFEMGSIVVYIDGNKHALMGARGKVAVDYTSNNFPVFKFEMMGLYIDPVYEESPQTPCYAPPMPLEMNHDNTTWELHGISTALYSLSIDAGTNPHLTDLPGQKEIEITDRTVSGSIEFAASRVDQKNWFESVNNAETGALKIVHGTTAGNIVECIASKVQLLEPKYGDQDQRRSNQFNLNIMPSPTAGEHELAFIFR